MLSSSPNTYILVINGKPQGPFTLQQLKELKIKPGDFVKSSGMDDYKEANELPELREVFGFNKAVFLQYFGSFDQRLMASALDWFFVSGVCLLLALVVSLFINDKIARVGIVFSLVIVIPTVKLIYHIIMESSIKQGTYGKQLLKIRVCDMQGSRLSLTHAAGRNFAKIFSVLTIFIGYLYSFFSKQQRCLHDVIAGTLVIKDRLV